MKQALASLGLILLAQLSLVVGLWIPIRILMLHEAQGGWNYLEVTGDVGQQWWFRLGFFVHLATAAPVVIVGWTQFLPWIRRSLPKLHRWIGRGYVLLVLGAAAPSGLVLSFGAAGGWPAQVAFWLVCPVWAWVTYLGYHHARKGNYQRHQQMMIRSYALSFGAVSLRLWMFVMGGLLEWRTAAAYATCVWLAWGVNVLVAEGLIALRRR